MMLFLYFLLFLNIATSTKRKDLIKEYNIRKNSFKKFFNIPHNCSSKKNFLNASIIELLYTDFDLGYDTSSDSEMYIGESSTEGFENNSPDTSSELSCDPEVESLKFKFDVCVQLYPKLDFIDFKVSFFMTPMEIKKMKGDDVRVLVQINLFMNEDYEEVYISNPYRFCEENEYVRLVPFREGVIFSIFRCMVRKYGYQLYENSEEFQKRLKNLGRKITDNKDYLEKMAELRPLKHLSRREDLLELIRCLLDYLENNKLELSTHVFYTFKFFADKIFLSKKADKYFVLELFQDLSNLINCLENDDTKKWTRFIFDNDEKSIEQDLNIYIINPQKKPKRVEQKGTSLC